ncbi:MAG: ComF family protein [Planctomycetales bacterium]|nr:ComF family protein [Planctomycetales bacterium]
MPLTAGTGVVCLECEKKQFRFDSTITMGSYEGLIRDAVLRMKHNGQEALSMAVADAIWNECEARLFRLELDVVAPVPMHWWRRLTRGVNGPELLAENLARRLRIPVANRLLIRRRNTSLQIDLTPAERRRNLHNAFRASAGYHLDGARVLLVDDVMTTGATANEAARTLKRAGAGQVDVFVFGRAHGHT